MSNKNLSTVTTDLIESYGNTAKNMIQAYRMGHQRVALFVDQRWEKALQQSASPLRTEMRKNALAAQKSVNGLYVKGIALTSDGADVLVNKAVELAGKGVQKASATAGAFEKRTVVATTLNSLARFTVPAAVVVSGLAGKLEQGSSSLANTLTGKSTAVAVAPSRKVAPHKSVSASVVKKSTRKVAARPSPAPRIAARKTTTKSRAAAVKTSSAAT